MSISLMVGLGNPGLRYQFTRHNVGFWFLESLVQHNTIPLHIEKKFKGRVGCWKTDGMECHLLLPDTYMNDSGQAVQAIATFYKIMPEKILVIHDELDLPCGTVRFKQAGGHGGHNGLRDIIQQLNNAAFFRLRIGIGRPTLKEAVANYVLNMPNVAEKKAIEESIERALMVLPQFVRGNTQAAIQALHTI